jgi:CRP/FNR family cyclic AMP-dependent transcriptional regulator
MRVGGAMDAVPEEFVRRFTAGTVIFKEGDPGVEMFIIQQGQVAIYRKVGRQTRQLAVLEKGDFFGEMALLEDYPERSATAKALTDVEVLQLRGADLELLVRRRPSVALRMMAKLSERLRESNRRLEEAAGRRADHLEHFAMPASQGIEAWALLVHPQSGRVFPLRAVGDTAIGRHDPVTGVTPDIDLNSLDLDRTVSRRHAVVRSHEGQLTVTETNAETNGTFVNGEKLEAFREYPLAAGDMLQLALVTLRVHVISTS